MTQAYEDGWNAEDEELYGLVDEAEKCSIISNISISNTHTTNMNSELNFGLPWPQKGIKGKDIFQQLSVSLEEAYNGTMKKISVHRNIICEKCQGVGGTFHLCPMCDGTGIQIQVHESEPENGEELQCVCPQCCGRRECITSSDYCETCWGKKVIIDRQVLEVHVEQGMANGQKIVFKGEGDQMPGAEAGDVVVLLDEREHEVYKRSGNDLIMKLNIQLSEALHGFRRMIKALDNRELDITIAPGEITKYEDVKCIPNEGMPVYNNPSERGVLLIQLLVNFPSNPLPQDAYYLSARKESSEVPHINQRKIKQETPPEVEETKGPVEAANFLLRLLDTAVSIGNTMAQKRKKDSNSLSNESSGESDGKRTKKAKLSKKSGESDMSEGEIQDDGSLTSSSQRIKINPEEIPKDPENKLYRPVGRWESKPADESRKNWKSVSKVGEDGRHLRGRGVFQYRARSESYSPPHWRQEQDRLIKYSEYEKKCMKEQRRRDRYERHSPDHHRHSSHHHGSSRDRSHKRSSGSSRRYDERDYKESSHHHSSKAHGKDRYYPKRKSPETSKEHSKDCPRPKANGDIQNELVSIKKELVELHFDPVSDAGTSRHGDCEARKEEEKKCTLCLKKCWCM